MYHVINEEFSPSSVSFTGKCITIYILCCWWPCLQKIKNVAILTLGSWRRQRLTRARVKREARECGRMWKWTLRLPSELPFWELEFWWTPEPLESDCKGQNPLDYEVPYIIGKLLECKCLKWADMTHSTSETQVMAKRKAGSQIGSLILDH
jgi:hypothetical protein